MPLSMEGYFTKQLEGQKFREEFNTWEERLSSTSELRDITNSEQVDSEQERQSKSKMFLE
jgi:hypothetical protein